MKICILTSNMRGAHITLSKMIPKYNDQIDMIVESVDGFGIKRVPFSRGIKTLVSKAGLRYTFYSMADFLSYSLVYRLMKFFNLFIHKYKVTKWDACAQEKGINILKAKNVNDPEVVKKIQETNPDLILSVYFDQLICNEIINIPSYGCINVHPSLLPELAGTHPNFYALLYNKEKAGVTLHYMSDKLDGGDIVAQSSFVVKNNHTVMSMDTIAANLAADLLKDLIDTLNLGNPLKKSIQDQSKRSFYNLPNKTMVKKFKRIGKRLFVLKDLYNFDIRE